MEIKLSPQPKNTKDEIKLGDIQVKASNDGRKMQLYGESSLIEEESEYLELIEEYVSIDTYSNITGLSPSKSQINKSIRDSNSAEIGFEKYETRSGKKNTNLDYNDMK